MIGVDRIRLRSPHWRWLGVNERSNAPKVRFAARKAPMPAARSRRRSSVTTARCAPADSPPMSEASRQRKLAPAVLEQPARRVLTVVGPRRIGMLRGEAVVDADRAQPGGLRQGPERRILEVGGAERPAPAVQVQIRARRPLGRQHPQAGDLTPSPGS